MSEIELPEPAGHVVNMGGEDGWGVSDHTSTYDLDSGCDVYTAEQVRATILAERERCAALCDILAHEGTTCQGDMTDLYKFGEAIRRAFPPYKP